MSEYATVPKLHHLFQSEGLRQSVLFTVGNLFAYAISAIALLLVSKRLGPTVFAEFWTAVAFMTILAKIQTLGIPVVLQKLIGKHHHQPRHISSIFLHSIIIVLLSCCVGTVIGAAAGYQLGLLLRLQLPELLVIASCCAGITALFEVLMTFNQATHAFTQAIFMLVLQSSAKLAIALLFYFSVQLPLIVLFTLFYFMPLLSVGWAGYQIISQSEKKQFSDKLDPAQIAKILHILPHATVMVVGVAIMDYLDVFFLRKFSTPIETGLYGGVSQFALGVSVIAQAVGGVLAARVSRYHHWADLSSYLKKIPYMFAMIGLSFVLFLPLALPLVNITLGSNYIAAVPVLVGLIAAALIFAATLPFAAVLYLEQDRSVYFSLSTGIMISIQVIGGVFLIPKFGANGAVLIRMISRTAVFVYSFFAVGSFLRRKYSAVRSNPS